MLTVLVTTFPTINITLSFVLLRVRQFFKSISQRWSQFTYINNFCESRVNHERIAWLYLDTLKSFNMPFNSILITFYTSFKTRNFYETQFYFSLLNTIRVIYFWTYISTFNKSTEQGNKSENKLWDQKRVQPTNECEQPSWQG